MTEKYPRTTCAETLPDLPRDESGNDSLAGILSEATAQLQHSGSARLDAELLLAHALQRPRSYLHAWPQTILSSYQRHQYRQLIARRAAGEPVAYLTGAREFWSMKLRVTSDTLIPRPETETLVELALERIPDSASWWIADLGTGSGAIALALAVERPQCNIIATDHTLATLAVACHNGHRLAAGQVHFLIGDWCKPLRANVLDMILCNPPYIAENDPHLSATGVRFEPRSALASGTDGLRDLRNLIGQALHVLRPGGWLLLEHGYQQAPAVLHLLATGGYRNIAAYKDTAGNPRVAVCRTPGNETTDA